jgi:hypothetical protein
MQKITFHDLYEISVIGKSIEIQSRLVFIRRLVESKLDSDYLMGTQLSLE